MKSKLLTMALLLMGVSAGAQVVQFSISNDCSKNGQHVDFLSGEPDGVEMVDLGLSVKWANMNVGATVPEEYGLYFAWGETQGYTGYTNDGRSFDMARYKYCKGLSTTMTKYCTKSSHGNNGFTDGKTVLEIADDAATVNWRGVWRMPTDAEWTELRTNCNWTWTQVNGVNGYCVSASNGNSIFLPAAGYRTDTYLYNAGSRGYFWSASLDSSFPYYAYDVDFSSGSVREYYFDRSSGLSVRPVHP